MFIYTVFACTCLVHFNIVPNSLHELIFGDFDHRLSCLAIGLGGLAVTIATGLGGLLL